VPAPPHPRGRGKITSACARPRLAIASRPARRQEQHRGPPEQVQHASDFASLEAPASRMMTAAYPGISMLENVLLFIVLLVLLFVMMSVKIVHQGYRYTIEHFGRFVRVASPASTSCPPFFYRVGRKINMMEQVLDIRARRSSPRTMPWSRSTAWSSSRCSTRQGGL
jgi:hypothetical protein